MAEASHPQQWRSRRNLQVIWLIDEINNSYLPAITSKLSTKKLLGCGDELDDECVFFTFLHHIHHGKPLKKQQAWIKNHCLNH